MADDSDDRTEEPTQRRLEKAREQGDIIYSSEVGAALSLIAVTALLSWVSGPVASGVAHGFIAFLAAPDQFSTDPASLMRIGVAVSVKAMGIFGMVALALGLAGLAARYLQDQPTFTAERLSPKFDKFDPVKGFKRVFGKAAFATFLKSMVKFIVVGAALASALWPKDAELQRISLLDPAALLPFVKDKAVGMLIAMTSAAALLAAVDYVFTRQSYMKRLRMSRREIKEEMRQSEGDPMIKAKLRQMRQERARKRMLAQVPKASVVITNPTHYAIALRYEVGETAAPVCLAKGVDDVALRIREVAEEHNIPIVEEPPLARALFASADLDEPIPREHYEAVAKVIGFVMRLANRRRRVSAPPNRRQ
ncbi:MAG: flagellar biosynthesis protein FlhB [Alphaproteobacteria bacterium]